MRYSVFKSGTIYLQSENIDELKELLIGLAKQNKGVHYVVREEGILNSYPARFSVKRHNVSKEIPKNNHAYLKQDILQTTECRDAKIFVENTLFGEEKVKIEIAA